MESSENKLLFLMFPSNLNVLNKAIDELNLKPTQTWGELVEDRGTQITYSAL